MKKWVQADLNQIQNILIALRKAKYEVQGEEILAFGQAVRWISMLHDEVKNSLQALPSKTELVAKATSVPSSSKKNKKEEVIMGLSDQTPTIQGATDGTEIGNVVDALKVAITSINSNTYEPQTFSLIASDIAIGNNKSMVALRNATGSGKIIRVCSIKIINSQTSAITGVVTDFRIRRITSFSAGTAITPLPFDTTNALSGSVTAATNSTVAGEATGDLLRVEYSTDEWGVGAQDVESMDHVNQALVPLFQTQINQQPIILRENEGLTIKNVVNSTAGTFDFEIIFTQV